MGWEGREPLGRLGYTTPASMFTMVLVRRGAPLPVPPYRYTTGCLGGLARVGSTFVDRPVAALRFFTTRNTARATNATAAADAEAKITVFLLELFPKVVGVEGGPGTGPSTVTSLERPVVGSISMGVGVGVLELPVGGGSGGDGVGSGELLPEYVAEAVESLRWCVEDRVGDGDVLDVRVTDDAGCQGFVAGALFV